MAKDPAWFAAKAAGKTRYMPLNPCFRGHISERQVSNNQCLACNKLLAAGHEQLRIAVLQSIHPTTRTLASRQEQMRIRELKRKLPDKHHVELAEMKAYDALPKEEQKFWEQALHARIWRETQEDNPGWRRDRKLVNWYVRKWKRLKRINNALVQQLEGADYKKMPLKWLLQSEREARASKLPTVLEKIRIEYFDRWVASGNTDRQYLYLFQNIS